MPVYDRDALDAPHTRRELGMSDDLVKRLELPWPADDSGAEVTLPIWVLELLAEAKDRIEALTAEVVELASSNITLSKIVTPSASHPVISRFCGLSVAEILSLTARIEAAEAKLAQGVRVKPGYRVDAYDLTMGGKTVPLDRAIDAVPAAQIADEALEQAAAWCADEADKCDDAVKWGGSRQYVKSCKDAAYALRNAHHKIRAVKGTMK